MKTSLETFETRLERAARSYDRGLISEFEAKQGLVNFLTTAADGPEPIDFNSAVSLVDAEWKKIMG